MTELRNLLVGLLVVMVLVNMVPGQGERVVLFMTDVAALVRTVLIAVALPVLMIGGLIYVSPWHRKLGLRMMAGALAGLMLAVLGPLALHWLEGQLAANSLRLFGGQP